MYKEELTIRELEKLVVGCLLVNKEMGFYPAQVEHATASIREIQDTSTGYHVVRIEIALTAIRSNYNYGYASPIESGKRYNHLTSGVNSFIRSF
jgi:hypothetical protein